MKEFSIYWNDLTEAAQKELYEFLDGENGNYDMFPIVTLEIEADEDEDI